MRGRSFDPLKNAQLEQLPPPQRNFVTITVYYTTIPEGEVNSGTVYIYRDAKRRGMYLALFTEGDNWFSIYQIGWIKMKKVTFCKFKTSLRRNFVQFTNFLRILSSAFLRFCRKYSMKIIFYLPVNTDKPKFVTFLVFACTTASFIAQNLSFENVSKRDVILTPVAKQ